jgi:hypothetical protein
MRTLFAPIFFSVLLCLGSGPATGRAADPVPLHARIDALLERGQPGGQAALAGDAEFLRRAWLTLHGTIPGAEQARAFLADQAPDKRAKLVDSLLADRQYARWMAVRLDVGLMERRGETHTKAAQWRDWLEESIVANRPWNDLVRDLIASDGSDEKANHTARWILEREADQNALTKDVGRLFLGQDIGCAQCHDHPRIDDYSQRDYAGIQAFFNRTYLFRPDTKKPGIVAEQASGDLSYLSVFTKASGTTRPRLPGEAELAEPAPGEWAVAPNEKDKTVRPIPKHSRRALLADTIGTGNHPQFRRNIANRLWAFVFGRGLVEPLDMDHSANPASHPELMGLLAEEIAAMKFDMKAFVRELALTRAFQRSLDLPATAGDAATLTMLLPELEKTAEVLDKAANTVAETFRAAQKEVVDASIAAAPFSADLVKAEADVAAAKKAADEAAAPLKASEEKAAPLREAHQASVAAAAGVAEAIAKSGETPELLASAKTFQAKADATAKPLQAAEADLAAKRTAAEAKTKILADAQAKSTAAKAKLAEAEKIVAAKQAIQDEAAKSKESARILALHTAQLAAEAKASLAWHTATAGIDANRKAADAAGQSVAAAKAKAAQIQAAMANGPAQLAALESAHAAAQTEATKALEAATAKTPASAALAEAAAKVAAAAAKFPDDAELKQAAAVVKSRSDAVASEIDAATKAAAAIQGKVDEAAKRLADAKSAQERIRADLSAIQAQIPGLETAASAAKSKITEAETAANEAREALATAWGRSFASMDLLPLSPEQLCWSIMQATGQIEPLRAAAKREWEAKNKFTEADQANPAKVTERDAGAEALYREKLRAQEAQFVRFFGGAAGQPQTDFFATPEQALYFENGGVVRNWASTLAGRAATLPDPKAMAEELYLSTLTRLPTATEAADFAAALAKRPPEQKAQVLGDAAWALLTSVEFRFSF